MRCRACECSNETCSNVHEAERARANHTLKAFCELCKAQVCERSLRFHPCMYAGGMASRCVLQSRPAVTALQVCIA